MFKASWFTKHDGPTIAVVGEREYAIGTATRMQIINGVEFNRHEPEVQAVILKALINRINYELDLIAVKVGVQ